MFLSTKRCFPPLPEANKLKTAHAKSLYDLLSEDAIKQKQDVTHIKCTGGVKNHFLFTCINHWRE